MSLSQEDHVTLRPAEAVEILAPRDLDPESIEKVITLDTDPAEAPIAEGDKLGTLSVRVDGKEQASVDLLAYTDVEASRLLVLWRDTKDFFAKTHVKIATGIAAALAALFGVWKAVFSKRRYRYGKSVGSGRSRNGYRGRRGR